MRGDAVAGILILLINIAGGLVVGVMQHNMALGQAAGTAAALAVEQGGDLRGIDMALLQARLRKAGAFLGN